MNFIDSMHKDNHGWTSLIQCTKIIMDELHFSFLVTLFDRFRFSKTRQNWPFFGIFNELLSAQNVNIARFARNATFSVIFKHCGLLESSSISFLKSLLAEKEVPKLPMRQLNTWNSFWDHFSFRILFGNFPKAS